MMVQGSRGEGNGEFFNWRTTSVMQNELSSRDLLYSIAPLPYCALKILLRVDLILTMLMKSRKEKTRRHKEFFKGGGYVYNLD